MEGKLIKSGVVDSVKIQTPNLPAGSFKYTILARDSAEPTKTRQAVVTGIVAGANLTVDMRTETSRVEVASI